MDIGWITAPAIQFAPDTILLAVVVGDGKGGKLFQRQIAAAINRHENRRHAGKRQASGNLVFGPSEFDGNIGHSRAFGGKRRESFKRFGWMHRLAHDVLGQAERVASSSSRRRQLISCVASIFPASEVAQGFQAVSSAHYQIVAFLLGFAHNEVLQKPARFDAGGKLFNAAGGVRFAHVFGVEVEFVEGD